MDNLTTLTVDEFLTRTAARTPTPGGGTVTGVAGALSCALARMVAEYSISKKTDDPTRQSLNALIERLSQSQRMLRELINEDARAYQTMTDAAKAARAPDASPDTGRTFQSAVLTAAAIPLQMAAVAADVLTTLDHHKTQLSRYLISDLGVAAALAEVVVRCARYTVWANLPELTDEASQGKLRSDAEAVVAHAASAYMSIHRFVQQAFA